MLYANATQYAKANNIQLGQALTQQQIGELTQPMLWYVEQTVPEPGCTATGTLTCPMVTPLMPQVYLPANTSALSADGNIVASDSIKLNFGNKDSGGSVLNTGTIASGGSLTVNTGTLTNQQNQVDVGQIWTNAGKDVDAGYEETTGTVVQPGGFMSAAAGQMTLNVSQLNQIGGLLQAVNPDGSANNAATQQLLGQVLQQLGSNFTQTTVSDDLHTHFVAAGGFGAQQLIAMVAAIAASIVTGGAAAAALGALANTLGGAMVIGVASGMAGSLASQVISGNGLDFGSLLQAGAIGALTAGAFSELGVGTQGLQQFGSKLANNIGSVTLSDVGQAVGAIAERGVVTAAIDTGIDGGSFAHALENSVISDVGAIGASAIGAASTNSDSALAERSPGYVLAHAGLGCALSAAEGNGCVGGAIGGAASALASPLLLGAIDPNHDPLTDGQKAALGAFGTLVGGNAGRVGRSQRAGRSASG